MRCVGHITTGGFIRLWVDRWVHPIILEIRIYRGERLAYIISSIQHSIAIHRSVGRNRVY